MLPPHLTRPSTYALHHIRLRSESCHQLWPSSHAFAGSIQNRTFYGGRRSDWFAHLDPLDSRALRYRTIKTKAKLFEKLRRRGKFDWDVSQKPFFSSQKYIRWASHYQDRSTKDKRSRDRQEDDLQRKPAEELDTLDSNIDVVWTTREQKWKEHMESLRKRVEEDPYDAVFGKRLEHFWGPLLPKWLRQDPSVDDSQTASQARSNTSQQESTLSQTSSTRHFVQPGRLADANDSTSKSSLVATSWNSWTDKAKRVEWDSVHGITKRYEYDPISNRMVEVNRPYEDKGNIEIANERCAPESEVNGKVRKLEDRETGQSAETSTNDAQTKITEDVEVEHLTAEGIRSAVGKSRRVSNVTTVLQPAIERRQVTIKAMDADDSAAHESTEPLPKLNPVSSRWSEQNDILQSARVDRTSSKSSGSLQTASAEDSGLATFDSSETTALRDSNARLRLELEQQRRILSIQEERSAGKVRSLRQELDIAYKQSSKHSAAHMDRIHTLEKALADAKGLNNKPRLSSSPTMLELRGEGDVCENVTKFASSSQWYKRPANGSSTLQHQTLGECISVGSDGTEMMGLSQDPKLQQALTAHEESTTYAFVPDNLEQELADESKETIRVVDPNYTFMATSAVRVLPSEPDSIQPEETHQYAFRTRTNESYTITSQKLAKEPSEPELVAYAYQKDTLEDELSAQLNPSEDSSENYSYPFKSDDLGSNTTLAKPVDHIDESQGYSFRPDSQDPVISLEQAISVNESHDYGFQPGDHSYTASSKHEQDPLASEPHQYSYQPDDAPLDATGVRSVDPMENAQYRYRDDKLSHKIDIFGREDLVVNDTSLEDALKAAGETTRPFVSDSLENELKKVVLAEPDHANENQYEFKDERTIDQNRENEQMPFDSKEQDYQFKPDNLAEEIAEEEKHVQQALVRAGADIPQPLVSQLPQGAATSGTQPETDLSRNVEWEEPPAYKVLAYDSGNDKMSTATTTSNVTSSETPLSIPDALAKLYQPSRFVSHLAELQDGGYQPIYGTHDLLVFRKVRSIGQAVSQQSVMDEDFTSIVDHGLVVPKENAVAQEAAEFYDRYQSPSRDDSRTAEKISDVSSPRHATINPIDLTLRSDIRPLTGNFASPTGFVNYDPVFPPEELDQPGERARPTHVRRTEPVFSGSSSARTGGLSRQQRAEERRQWREEQRQKRRRGAGAVRWALSVGVTSAALCYVIGVAAEASRRERREEERRS